MAEIQGGVAVNHAWMAVCGFPSSSCALRAALLEA